jgi:hypothetical protein
MGRQIKYPTPSFFMLPYIEISSGTPGGLNRRNVRKATVDLSGFTVRIGFKIRLF